MERKDDLLPANRIGIIQYCGFSHIRRFMPGNGMSMAFSTERLIHEIGINQACRFYIVFTDLIRKYTYASERWIEDAIYNLSFQILEK
jgi:hypothetical protein